MTRQTTERSLAEVWAQWRRTAVYGWLGPAELSLALVALLGPVLTGALGWLGLSWVHRTGPPWPAFARAVRAGALVFSPLAVTTLLSGAAFIVREHQLYRAGWPWPSTIEPGIVLFLGVSISLWILAWWLRRALDGVAESTAPLALPPRCEECGYDLTHRPADGRCPECGTPTENSLDALHSRPGSAWTQRRAAASWRVTSHEVLLRPRAFYRRLQLRTPPAAEAGFATRHYMWIAGGATLWAATMIVLLSIKEGAPGLEDLPEIGLVFCGMLSAGVFACWLGHRTIGALVTSWWLAQRALPDTGWAAKVVAYETTFLWVLCAFWGLALGSYVLAGAWLSNLVSAPNPRRLNAPFFILGIPIEVWAVALGTLALGVLWLWRYGVAYKSIRWSNF